MTTEVSLTLKHEDYIMELSVLESGRLGLVNVATPGGEAIFENTEGVHFNDYEWARNYLEALVVGIAYGRG